MGESVKLGEYLLAIQGLAMIRSVLTEPSVARPRVAEMRRVLDGLDGSLEIPLIGYEVAEGYSRWAEHYDGPNPVIAREQPIVHAMLAELPVGRALDAGCGTGRHAAQLLSLGHQVVGVDATAAMLAVARRRVAGVDFRRGDLGALPVQDASVDLVTCALTLSHVDDLRPVLAEFARVLRPGGQVVLSDIHPVAATTGAIAAFPGPDLAKGVPYVRSVVHQVSDYLRAIRLAGLEVLDCLEPVADESVVSVTPAFAEFPQAASQALLGLPYLLIWRLGRRS